MPRILIVSGAPLDDTRGISSSLVNFFKNYPKDSLAQIYFESSKPNTVLCSRFFQISEMSQVRKIFHWNTSVGNVVRPDNWSDDNKRDERMEGIVGRHVRSHRSYLYVFAREFIWGMNFWKNKRLESFIRSFDPDLVWFESYPLWFMHRLCMYVADVANKPSVIFLQDDLFYHDRGNLASRFYHKVLRRLAKKSIIRCKGHFVASPKMKQEYDRQFGINSVVLIKGIEPDSCPELWREANDSIQLLYAGNTVYGRIYTLLDIAKALRTINYPVIRFVLNIYTLNYLTDEQKSYLLSSPGVCLHDPVPYSEMSDIVANSDVLLLIESFEDRFKHLARLSFSTKIIDYLSSGRCIVAFGPEEIAPIEYMKNNDLAITISDTNRVEMEMMKLTKEKIALYAEKARRFALQNHTRERMEQELYKELIRVASHHAQS